MSRKLTTYVTVRDANLRSVTYKPGDDVPDWAASQITARSVWAQDESAHEARTEAQPTPTSSESAPERPKRGRPRKSTSDSE